MKTEVLIRNTGKTYSEAIDEIEKAELTLGVLRGSLLSMIYHPKVFVQRRKIGGNEALITLYITNGEGMMPALRTGEEFRLSLGKVVQIGMVIFTDDNAYLKEQRLLLSSKAYNTIDMAIYSFAHNMRKLQDEVKLLEFPVDLKVSKQNYDVIEGMSQPAQACLEATERLTGQLNTYRSQALNFAPNESVTEIVEEIDGLKTLVNDLGRRARRHLAEAYEVIKLL